MAYAFIKKKNPDLISRSVAVRAGESLGGKRGLVNATVELNLRCNQRERQAGESCDGRGREFGEFESTDAGVAFSALFVQPLSLSSCSRSGSSPNSLEDAICRQSLSYSIFSLSLRVIFPEPVFQREATAAAAKQANEREQKREDRRRANQDQDLKTINFTRLNLLHRGNHL